MGRGVDQSVEHYLTLISQRPYAERLVKALQTFSDEAPRYLSNQYHHVIDLRVKPSSVNNLRARAQVLFGDQGVDHALQGPERGQRKLLVMDMDSTLVQVEFIDELARLAGVFERVAQVTERAMQGALDFETSLRQRVACLAGLRWDHVVALSKNLPVTPGAERLVRVIHALGGQAVVVSGGFTVGAYALQEKINLDHAFANELEVREGRLTGRIVGEIVDAQKKVDVLKRLARRMGISRVQTVAMGDGANDIPMIQHAGLGVAFYGKPKVREAADATISSGGLDNLLYYFGLDDAAIERLLEASP